MEIFLSKRLKDDHLFRAYRSSITITNPRSYDREFGSETSSYTQFRDLEISKFGHEDQEESFSYKIIANYSNTLLIWNSDYKSLDSNDAGEKIRLSSIHITESDKLTFSIYLKPNDYSNFLINLNTAKRLNISLMLYKRNEVNLEDFAKLIYETKLANAEKTYLRKYMDIDLTEISFFS